ncbi:sensor histidine kinase [Culicoidibacter larvae]|uniref:histidine kinase n=1 Tax=Culicoidibacter larvae TaxID=2579976 RepID=A0A5R8QGQ9_9FIRM|nr:HAMP domain-containing sensor histidine kinase [Culicoidibacter larvae]TLG77221.1 HAMP domain-containing histidine kinase [Culicoidibacter larvae]
MIRKSGLKLSRQIILIFVIWMVTVILIITGLVQRTIITISEENAFVYLEQQETKYHYTGEDNYVKSEDASSYFNLPGQIHEGDGTASLFDPDHQINTDDINGFQNELLAYSKDKEEGVFDFDGDVYYFYRIDDKDGIWVSFINQLDIIRVSNDAIIQLLIPILIISGVGLIGAVFWVRYIVRPLREMEEQVQKISRRDWNQQLIIPRSDEVGQLAESIDNMRQQLIEQDQMQQRMLQHISHDLKTPISIISACAESIQDGVYPYGTLEETANVILKQSNRLNRKVKDLLYVTQLEYLLSQDAREYQSVDIQAILEDVTFQMKYRFPQFEWEIELKPLAFFGDEESWRIVFENILENEVRYANTKLIVRTDEDSVYLANDGEPIAEDVISNIYNPYVKDEKGHYGLGMTIVSRTLQLFNYNITITNGDMVEFVIRKQEEKE